MASAIKINSGSGVITVPNAAAFQGLTAFTAEMYLNIQAVSDATFARVFDYFNGSNKGFNLYFNNLATTLSADVGNGTIATHPAFSTTLSLNTTYHIALVWDGSNVSLFVNGTKDGITNPLSGNTGNPAMSFYFGNEAAVDRGGKVTIDEFRLSNNARYTANFTAPTGPLGNDANTIELWHFDEGSGTTATGINSNVGTLSGTPTPAWVLALTPPNHRVGLLGVGS